ncbi:MAG TPA: hypothetical protein VGJ90_02290 [Methylophilaceae bacterium]|jgi:hypothetical protein
MNKFLPICIALHLIFSSICCAKGLKGNLEIEETEFLNAKIKPILLKAGICKKLTGDCNTDYIQCISSETLKCQIYGVSNEQAIKEILIEVLNSSLNFSSLTIWRSKWEQKSFFEKPVIQFINTAKD